LARPGETFPVEWNGELVKDCDKALGNVAIDAGLPDVTPHVLRHTAATRLMKADTDMWEAARYLGMTIESATTAIIIRTISRRRGRLRSRLG
jgi:integrase